MENDATAVRAGVEVALEPAKAFDVLVEELRAALERLEIQFDIGDGRVTESGVEVGRIIAWEPGRRVVLEWRPATWAPDEVTEVQLYFEPVPGGTRVTVDHRGWRRLFEDAGSELAGWFAGQVAAPLLRSTSPAGFGDWLTDRRARRPSGLQARATYRDPLYHRPNFRAILAALALTAGDYLLEVGCGGGAFLEEVLRSGCRAAAVDHSADMVRLAREVNREAIAAGRLDIVEARADRLPFPDAVFTCAVMTGVIGFLSDPVAALAEIRRTLRDGGRLALFTGSPEMRGTPAAPEPIAGRLYFYEDVDLVRLAREAGFAEVRVERPALDAFAREAGVPQEYLSLFSGREGQLLLAC